MEQVDRVEAPAREDAIDTMQRKLARFENPHMHLICTPEAVARARADAEAGMRRRAEIEAKMKRDQRIGLIDKRQDKVDRRLGDRRKAGRDEGP